MAVDMMARIGDAATLRIGVSTLTSVVSNEATSNYTTLGEVLTFNPQMECSEHDVTHMGSGAARQFIPGHLAATVQATLNLVPQHNTADIQTSYYGSTNLFNADHILDVYQGREHRNYIMSVTCSGTNTSDTTTRMMVAFRGFITNLSWSADRDAVNTADMTIRVSDSTMVEQEEAFSD